MKFSYTVATPDTKSPMYWLFAVIFVSPWLL